MIKITDTFHEQMRKVYGSRAEAWVRSLPELIAQSEAQFGIKVEAPFENLSYNYIAYGTDLKGKPIVLKLSFEKDSMVKEMDTLIAFSGKGTAEVIEVNRAAGGAVLERILPGTPLLAVGNDKEATEIFCEVFRRLHQLQVIRQEGFPTLRTWFGALPRYRERFGTAGPIPEYWFVRAEELLEVLLETTTVSELLHGDLHHENILKHGEHGWVVIDPKGMVGDVHFETIQYLLNDISRDGDCDTVLKRRVDMIADRLHLDRGRIARWGIVRGVLEACWAVEDDANWQQGIEISERFMKLLNEEDALK